MSKITIGIFLFIALSALLSGCALRALFGNVIIVEDIGEEVNEIITTVFSDSTAAVCIEADYGFFECTYIVDGDILTSTLYLLSEFGITGVLIDPVILQIPADSTDFTATYDNGSGPSPMSIRFINSFQVTPDISITAETNQKFLILELPKPVTDSLPGGDPENTPQYHYSLSYKRVEPLTNPVPTMNIKVMLAAKAIVNEHIYYVPTLPCITNFASLPAIEIPQSATPVNLQTVLGILIQQNAGITCDHQGYFFNNVPPPPLKVFLPSILR